MPVDASPKGLLGIKSRDQMIRLYGNRHVILFLSGTNKPTCKD